jgi:hypothetical protein
MTLPMAGRHGTLAAIAVAALLAGPARAESPAPAPTPATPDKPCATDIARFCKGVDRGGGKRRTCLLSHASELQGACRSRLQATRVTATTSAAGVAVPERLLACEVDIRTLCPGVSAGGGRLRGCLDLHTAKLTPGCAAALRGRAHR